MWFKSDYAFVSSEKSEIRESMKNNNYRDLITDPECIAGYESDFVIYVGPRKNSTYLSRCRGQFVHIWTDGNMQRNPANCLSRRHLRGERLELTSTQASSLMRAPLFTVTPETANADKVEMTSTSKISFERQEQALDLSSHIPLKKPKI